MGGARTGHEDSSGPRDAPEAEALDALRLAWGGTWDIGGRDDRWQAARRDGAGTVLTRASAEGLALALRISHPRHPR
jgi:hypothetical protein